MAIKVIAIGKKHESWVVEGIERYQKRLRQPFSVEWVLLPHSSLDGDRARQEESERLLTRTDRDDFVVLLDERGQTLDSVGVFHKIEEWLQTSRSIVIVIGGAYGVSDSLHKRSDYTWSLSPLVFPHQLVRLILTEQLYRAQQISLGGPYHHE